MWSAITYPSHVKLNMEHRAKTKTKLISSPPVQEAITLPTNRGNNLYMTFIKGIQSNQWRLHSRLSNDNKMCHLKLFVCVLPPLSVISVFFLQKCPLHISCTAATNWLYFILHYRWLLFKTVFEYLLLFWFCKSVWIFFWLGVPAYPLFFSQPLRSILAIDCHDEWVFINLSATTESRQFPVM